ncbi:MAG: hypothetical protein H0U27_03255 [Nitrosopumilus sp.]|nr:hypothetical protein [Nitrosopumilus sp.]
MRPINNILAGNKPLQPIEVVFEQYQHSLPNTRQRSFAIPPGPPQTRHETTPHGPGRPRGAKIYKCRLCPNYPSNTYPNLRTHVKNKHTKDRITGNLLHSKSNNSARSSNLILSQDNINDIDANCLSMIYSIDPSIINNNANVIRVVPQNSAPQQERPQISQPASKRRRIEGNIAPLHIQVADEVDPEKKEVYDKAVEYLQKDMARNARKRQRPITNYSKNVPKEELGTDILYFASKLTSGPYFMNKFNNEQPIVMDTTVVGDDTIESKRRMYEKKNCSSTAHAYMLQSSYNQKSGTNQKRRNTIVLNAEGVPNQIINALNHIGFCANSSVLSHKFTEHKDVLYYSTGKCFLFFLFTMIEIMHWLEGAVAQDRVGTVADNCHHSCSAPIYRATEEWKTKKGNAYLFDLFSPDDTGNTTLSRDHEISSGSATNSSSYNESSTSLTSNNSDVNHTDTDAGTRFNLRHRGPREAYVNSMHSEDMDLSSSMSSPVEPSTPQRSRISLSNISPIAPVYTPNTTDTSNITLFDDGEIDDGELDVSNVQEIQESDDEESTEPHVEINSDSFNKKKHNKHSRAEDRSKFEYMLDTVTQCAVVYDLTPSDQSLNKIQPKSQIPETLEEQINKCVELSIQEQQLLDSCIEQELKIRSNGNVDVLPESLTDFIPITPVQDLRNNEKNKSVNHPREPRFDDGYNAVMFPALFQKCASKSDCENIVKVAREAMFTDNEIVASKKSLKTGDFQTWVQFRKIQHDDPNSGIYAIIGDFHVLFAIAEGIGRLYENLGLKVMSSALGIDKLWYFLRDVDFKFAKNIILITCPAIWNVLTEEFKTFMAINYPTRINTPFTATEFRQWGRTLVGHRKVWFKFITEDGLCFRRMLEAIRYRNWDLRVLMLKMALRLCIRSGKTHYQRAITQHLFDLEYVISQYHLELLKLNFSIPCKEKLNSFIAIDELVELLNKWIKQHLSVVLHSRVHYVTTMHNLIANATKTFDSQYMTPRASTTSKKLPKSIAANFTVILKDIYAVFDEAISAPSGNKWDVDIKYDYSTLMSKVMKQNATREPDEYFDVPETPENDQE